MAAFVYILASRRNGTLYIRVTSDLLRRVSEHRDGLVGGFTRKYGVKMLVYFEETESIVAAIQREKTLKHWVRRWKLNLIEASNPEWRDLWDEIGRGRKAQASCATCVARSLGPRDKREDDGSVGGATAPALPHPIPIHHSPPPTRCSLPAQNLSPVPPPPVDSPHPPTEARS